MEQLAILNNVAGLTAEQQEAAAMHFEIVQAAKTAVNSLLDLGRKLKRMRDSGRYKDLGFASFAEYTEAAVGIKQRQAYNYIQVVESLPARLIEENAAAGVTKLALLAKLNPEEREDLTGEALANITVAELKKLVEERDAMAQQLSIFQTEPEAVAEVEAEPIDPDEIRRQAEEETRQQMAAAFAEERTQLEAKHKAAMSEAVLKAEQAAAAEVRKGKADAKKQAEAETRQQVAQAREEAAKAAAAKAAQTTNTSTNDSTELPSNGGKLSSGGRALAATKTGGNFKASVYAGNTGASNLSYYQSLNSDVKAWLKIPGTNINYPVLQNASEDHYYLHRGLDRGQSYYGVLWTQTATRFGSGDSLSSNNVIYGHNWKNCRWNAAPSTYYVGQQMFESLLSYHYTSWAEQYPYIYYSTPSEEMAFVIFACFYTEGSDWYINAEGNIDGVISGAQSRSRHNFGVDVNSSDKLLTLSTCTRYYGNTDNQRFVVMARLLRPGEEMGPVSVTYNPNHQQPNVWG